MTLLQIIATFLIKTCPKSGNSDTQMRFLSSMQWQCKLNDTITKKLKKVLQRTAFFTRQFLAHFSTQHRCILFPTSETSQLLKHGVTSAKLITRLCSTYTTIKSHCHLCAVRLWAIECSLRDRIFQNIICDMSVFFSFTFSIFWHWHLVYSAIMVKCWSLHWSKINTANIDKRSIPLIVPTRIWYVYLTIPNIYHPRWLYGICALPCASNTIVTKLSPLHDLIISHQLMCQHHHYDFLSPQQLNQTIEFCRKVLKSWILQQFDNKSCLVIVFKDEWWNFHFNRSNSKISKKVRLKTT